MKKRALIALCCLVLPASSAVAARGESWKCATAWYWVLMTGGKGCR